MSGCLSSHVLLKHLKRSACLLNHCTSPVLAVNSRFQSSSSSPETHCTSKYGYISNTDFCLEIANRVGLQEAKEGSNSVISPISIHACMSLLAAGTKGKTLDQLLYYLKSKTIDDLHEQSSRIVKLMSSNGSDEASPLSFANSVWADKGFPLKLPFQEIARGKHGAQVRNVDFKNDADQAAKEINLWVESATNGIIKDLISSSNCKDTRLVLANALSFLGAWDRPFNGRLTEVEKFHLINGKTVQVPFLSRYGWDREELFRSFDGFKVLSLPYKNVLKNRELAMYFFLPNEKNGLKKLIEKFSSDVGFFNQDFRLKKVQLNDFQIPKFKISFGFEASKTMKGMGLDLPFGITGEISEIMDDSGEGLFVSNIVHRSCVEVNEAGTVAAACTYQGFAGGAFFQPRPTFVADHPFMFMIREETSRVLLFVGNVLDPSTS